MAMPFWEPTARQVRELDAATRSRIDAAIAQYVQRYQDNPNIVEWGRKARQNLVAERR